jgi:hypothetical protein
MDNTIMDSAIHIGLLGTMTLPERKLKSYPAIIGFNLNSDLIMIGAQVLSPPSVTLNEPGVSRKQAKVFRINDLWYVEDLGSDNGSGHMVSDAC